MDGFVDATAGLDALTATEMLSTVQSTRYTVVGALTGGETGATEIRRADGKRFVLKWENDVENQQLRKLGADFAERLRAEAGWPSPAQQLIEVDDVLLIVQEFMPGTTVEHLTHAVIDRILDLHRARTDLAITGDSDEWATYLLHMLTHGGNDYSLHEPLRTFDARTRRAIERFEEIGRTTDPTELTGSNIVHFDFHPGNLLQVGGEMTAVVDMDYTRIGDAAFDLTMLAISSLTVTVDPGVRSRLFTHGIDALSDPKHNVYVANILLRYLDWSVRKSRYSDAEFWLAETERLLPS